MKTPIFVTAAALCATCGLASAQTAPRQSDKNSSGDGVHLRDVPGIGGLFRAPIPPVPVKPIPELELDLNQPAGTHLKSLKFAGEDVLQVEAVRQSLGEILRTVTNVMGVRAIIDPELQRKSFFSLTFRGKDFDDLLANMTRSLQVEMVKSPVGTYFFADASTSARTSPTFGFSTPIFPPALPSQNFKSFDIDPEFANPGLKSFGIPNWKLPDSIDPEFANPNSKSFGIPRWKMPNAPGAADKLVPPVGPGLHLLPIPPIRRP